MTQNVGVGSSPHGIYREIEAKITFGTRPHFSEGFWAKSTGVARGELMGEVTLE